VLATNKIANATKIIVGVSLLISMTSANTQAAEGTPHTPITPIRHLIVIVGENHSFDNLFGAYQPVGRQTVSNLLSKGIINADGTSGPHSIEGQQWQASVTDKYSIAPQRTQPFATLPQPNSTFAFGRKPNEPDSRFPADLPDGPFQLSHYAPCQLSFTGDPVHRFFQMWQQFDQGRSDLFPWVATTIGMGSEGKPRPVPFTDQSTH
jgi:phospholipase C